MSTPRHILVFRFSALGDIAMTVPVLKCVLQQHPDLQLTVVSVPFVKPLFEGIDRLHFYGADVKKDYKGVMGLQRLAKKIKKEIPYTAIADLHNVVRTKLLRFFAGNVPKAAIDKGRREKKELTRPIHKKLRPLKTTFQRYADVFSTLGITVELNTRQGTRPGFPDIALLPPAASGKKLIGIAPFAKHAAKLYPLERMKETVALLAQNHEWYLVLIGGKAEAALLQEWETISPAIFTMAGKFSFAEELQLISQLDLVISMDSANMHLASLYGVPVVSLWGGTHPYLGFYGWGQPEENILQSDLPCRPSSVFGKTPCPVHGAAGCMQEISPQQIAAKVSDLLKKNEQ